MASMLTSSPRSVHSWNIFHGGFEASWLVSGGSKCITLLLLWFPGHCRIWWANCSRIRNWQGCKIEKRCKDGSQSLSKFHGLSTNQVPRGGKFRTWGAVYIEVRCRRMVGNVTIKFRGLYTLVLEVFFGSINSFCTWRVHFDWLLIHVPSLQLVRQNNWLKFRSAA